MKLFTPDPDSDSPAWRRRVANLPLGVKWGTGALILLILVLTVWLFIEGAKVKSHLENARESAQQAKDALLGGRSEEASRLAENTQFHARQAQAAAHSTPWTVAAAVPILGSPLLTTKQISDVVVGLADDVLLPAANLGMTVSPDKLIEGNRIDLNLLRGEQEQLSELSTSALRLDGLAQAIRKPAYLSAINNARTALQGQTTQLSSLLGNTAIAAELAPPMMGADGPRTYLMAFQTPAEARGTGGLVGGFGVLRFDEGIPTIGSLAPNTTLSNPSASVNLGSEFDEVYGWTNPFTDFRNSNLSPHFPFAAQIWRSMWERQTGERVDGVIALDPITLSYILGVIGPVITPDGDLVKEDNVVDLTMSKAYTRFPDDQAERKNYLQRIAQAVVKKMAGPIATPRALLDALGRAANEGRIAVWSAVPAEQELLEKTPLAHAVPMDSGPYAQVVINNLAGNKMDYYLKREIEYVADGCDGDMRNSTVTVRLTNTAAAGEQLPQNVGGTMGIAPGISLKVPDGSMVSSVRVLSTRGAKLMSATADGERTPAIQHIENGRPSFEVQVIIPPGQTGELVFRLSEPTSPGEARVPIQPLTDNLAPRVEVPACQ